MKQKVKKIIYSILITLSLVLFSLTVYILKEFNVGSFEQLLYAIKNSQNASPTVIIDGIKYCLPIILIGVVILLPFLYIRFKNELYLKIKNKNKEIKIKLIPMLSSGIYTLTIFLGLTVYSLYKLEFFDYSINIFKTSNLYEKYYVDPNNVEVNFNEKRNLIMIYIESLENSYANMKIDNKETNIIPNLYDLANDNLNFSNTEKIGGGLQLKINDYTSGALTASLSATPIKVSLADNSYGIDGEFLPGTKMLGDFLEEAGYKNYFLLGSDAIFGGRKNMFETHGNYEILDYNWAIKEKLIGKDYYEWWGYEDSKLYEYAKSILSMISKNKEPFNFTILTADTHFTDGYLDNSCNEEYSYKYANSIKCADKMIKEFTDWVISQDFYKNTTIVIVGDHLTMQADLENYINKNDVRTVYNVFINTEKLPMKSKNRQFTTFDLYPTVLASIGAEIEGDRLGLGTNLFSDKKTLTEQLGHEYLNNEIKKNSNYYNDNLLYSSK